VASLNPCLDKIYIADLNSSVTKGILRSHFIEPHFHFLLIFSNYLHHL